MKDQNIISELKVHLPGRISQINSRYDAAVQERESETSRAQACYNTEMESLVSEVQNDRILTQGYRVQNLFVSYFSSRRVAKIFAIPATLMSGFFGWAEYPIHDMLAQLGRPTLASDAVLIGIASLPSLIPLAYYLNSRWIGRKIKKQHGDDALSKENIDFFKKAGYLPYALRRKIF